MGQRSDKVVQRAMEGVSALRKPSPDLHAAVWLADPGIRRVGVGPSWLLCAALADGAVFEE